MRVVPARIPDVLLLEPEVHRDERGYLFEAFNRRTLLEAAGLDFDFVQENESRSAQNVLRGLHYQIGRPQGKLVRAVSGRIFDVAVDLRRSSPTFGQWAGTLLSGEEHRMVWIPPGFAHGFLVVSGPADVLYKATDYYAPDCQRTLRWDDPDLGIEWPLADGAPQISAKDALGADFRNAEAYD
ncbi:MAG: dTDP-4-dehydrorhamnose 3,5-epimerase [Burkholderiales bacterium]